MPQCISRLTPTPDEEDDLCNIVDISFAMKNYGHVEILSEIKTIGNKIALYEKLKTKALEDYDRNRYELVIEVYKKQLKKFKEKYYDYFDKLGN